MASVRFIWLEIDIEQVLYVANIDMHTSYSVVKTQSYMHIQDYLISKL